MLTLDMSDVSSPRLYFGENAFVIPANAALLVIVSGIMGSGKGTVTTALLKAFPGKKVDRALSATTRHKRPGEEVGDKYVFFTRVEFMQHEEMGDFLEVNPAFANGERYGTLGKELGERLACNDVVFHEVNIAGARSIRETYQAQGKKERLLTVFIKPNEPWREVVLARIGEDKQNPRDGIKARLKEAEDELACAGEYDMVIENKDGELESAVDNIMVEISRRF